MFLYKIHSGSRFSQSRHEVSAWCRPAVPPSDKPANPRAAPLSKVTLRLAAPGYAEKQATAFTRHACKM